MPLPPDAFCPACVAAAAAAVPQTPPLKPPSTWTSAAVKELKAKLRTEKDSMVTVYRGDIMTVHVPTIPEAKKVCWEFATDGYDIGFGIYFDWTPVTSRSITVHISESSDDEDEEEELEGLWRSARSRLRPTRRPFFVKTTRRNRTLMCLSASWDCRLCVDFVFMCFRPQGLSATGMWRRAPRRRPTPTWLKSCPCTARTATCPSTGGATTFQVKARTSWSLIIPTHYGETKHSTTEFITVPDSLAFLYLLFVNVCSFKKTEKTWNIFNPVLEKPWSHTVRGRYECIYF